MLAKYSRIRFGDKEVMWALAGYCAEHVPTLEVNRVARIAERFCLGQGESKPFFNAVATAIHDRIAELEPQGIVQALGCLSRRPLFVPMCPVIATLTTHVQRNIGQFDSCQLSNISHSLASLRIRDAALFAAIDAAVSAQPLPVGAFYLSMLLWSFASVGRPPSPALLARLLAALEDELLDASAQDVCNSMWALAALDCTHVPLMEKLCTTAGQFVAMGAFSIN